MTQASHPMIDRVLRWQMAMNRGDASVSFPSRVDDEEMDDVEKWFSLIRRTLGRMATPRLHREMVSGDLHEL